MDHWLLAWLVAANIIASVTVGKGNALNWMFFSVCNGIPIMSGRSSTFSMLPPKRRINLHGGITLMGPQSILHQFLISLLRFR